MINKLTNSITKLYSINSWLFVFMVAALPVSLFANNLLLTVFVITFLGWVVLTKQTRTLLHIKNNKWHLVILNIPIILLLLGALYSPAYKQAFKELGRVFPILLMALYVLAFPSFFYALRYKIAYALIGGCIIAFSVCWGVAVTEILTVDTLSLSLFFQEFTSHHLADNLGVHTPYLALFVNLAIISCIWLLHTKQVVLPLHWLWTALVVLLLFLGTLMARNAVFSVVVLGLVYLLFQKRKVYAVLYITALTATFIFIQTTEHNFLRDRFIKSVNVFENETIFSKQDSRFARWDASYKVFKQFPWAGPGTANEDSYRKAQFYINRDSEAYNDNYNAHNQFMEYLSTYGILGGLSYILLWFVLFRQAYIKKSGYLFFITAAFFIANITESMLERSWGIVCYILLFTLLFCWPKPNKTYQPITKKHKC